MHAATNKNAQLPELVVYNDVISNTCRQSDSKERTLPRLGRIRSALAALLGICSDQNTVGQLKYFLRKYTW
jgi:hypothetical protein